MTPDRVVNQVPFEFHVCVYEQQPSFQEQVTTAWGKLYLGYRNCYLRGEEAPKTSVLAKLDFSFEKTASCWEKNCYVPDPTNEAATKAYNHYFECLADYTFDSCKKCGETREKGFQNLVDAECITCQKLCEKRAKEENFVQDKNFDHWTFPCNYYCIAKGEYPFNSTVRNSLTATK